MSLTLMKRPLLPGMPAEGEPVHTHNTFTRTVSLNCTPDVQAQATADLKRIDLLLWAFASIPITGTIIIVVLPGQPIAFDGILTAYYWESMDSLRNEHLRRVDLAITNFKRTYQPWLERAEFKMRQTILIETDNKT